MARSFLSICAVSEQVNGRPDSRTFSTSSVVHFHWWQLVFSGKIVYIFVTTFCRLLTTLGVFSANRLSFVLDATKWLSTFYNRKSHAKWNDNNTVLPYANWKLSSEYSCLINANCEEFDKFGNTSSYKRLEFNVQSQLTWWVECIFPRFPSLLPDWWSRSIISAGDDRPWRPRPLVSARISHFRQDRLWTNRQHFNFIKLRQFNLIILIIIWIIIYFYLI